MAHLHPTLIHPQCRVINCAVCAHDHTTCKRCKAPLLLRGGACVVPVWTVNPQPQVNPPQRINTTGPLMQPPPGPTQQPPAPIKPPPAPQQPPVHQTGQPQWRTEPCPADCATCTAAGVCTACKAAVYLDGSWEAGFGLDASGRCVPW